LKSEPGLIRPPKTPKKKTPRREILGGLNATNPRKPLQPLGKGGFLTPQEPENPGDPQKREISKTPSEELLKKWAGIF